MKKRQLIFLLKFLVLITLLLGGYSTHKFFLESQTIKIANWNLEIFGQAKVNNFGLMDFYVDKIKNYDIIFIQEIRDNSGTSFSKLCSMLQNYSCNISSRAGRTLNKEQYGIIYKDSVNLISLKDYNPDGKDRWERPPIEVMFNTKGYSLKIYNIHTKPEDVKKELEYLQSIISNKGNVIIFGDLNADCSYYSNEKENEFDSWNWIIKDNDDTTSAKTNCVYDRIILNSDADEEFKDYGIETKGITADVSDHYLVWVELKI